MVCGWAVTEARGGGGGQGRPRKGRVVLSAYLSSRPTLGGKTQSGSTIVTWSREPTYLYST